jgi:hypothetical protein
MDFHSSVPKAVKDAVENARKDIISGKVKVSNVPNAADLKALRTKLFPK